MYHHIDEGADDMPAHLKSSTIGCSLHIPIEHKRLMLGRWQALYLCEFRDRAPSRTIIASIQSSLCLS
jgi:secondary thiamine-phosphate synthase enzyme